MQLALWVRLKWRREAPGVWYAGGSDYCVKPAGWGYSTAKFRGQRIGSAYSKEKAQQLCQDHANNSGAR